jgi:hypothetical protein
LRFGPPGGLKIAIVGRITERGTLRATFSPAIPARARNGVPRPTLRLGANRGEGSW